MMVKSLAFAKDRFGSQWNRNKANEFNDLLPQLATQFAKAVIRLQPSVVCESVSILCFVWLTMHLLPPPFPFLLYIFSEISSQDSFSFASSSSSSSSSYLGRRHAVVLR